MKLPARVLLFVIALAVGVIALPEEFKRIVLLVEFIGTPLLSLVTHLAAVAGIMALIGISLYFIFSPIGKDKARKEKAGRETEAINQAISDDSARLGRATAELKRRQTEIKK